MATKLETALRQMITDVKEMDARIERVEKVKPVLLRGKDGAPGKDGKTPDVDAIVETVLGRVPAPKELDAQTIVNEVLAKIPPPRDGRDSDVTVSDVAAIVLAKIEKPKDGAPGKDGRDAPEMGAIVKQVRAQVRDGKPGAQGARGPAGPRGKPGKDGVSVTDVKLTNNDLFVSLDGKRKKVGSIVVPRPSVPVSLGGGGGSRRSSSSQDAIANRVIINAQSNWPAPVNGAIQLDPFTEYYIGSNDVGLPAGIELLGQTTITGARGVSQIEF